MSGLNRIERLKMFLQSDPDDAFLNYALAMEHLAEDNRTEAVSLLEKVLKLHPDYIPVYYQLGKIYGMINQTDEAINLFETGIQKSMSAKDFKTANELRVALDELEE